MKRREFLRNLALTGAGFRWAPLWKHSGAATMPEHAGPIPSLDELAGDWISGKQFEQTPCICNFHGGIQAGRLIPLEHRADFQQNSDVLSVSGFVNFPLAQGGEVGQLFLDDQEIAADDYRWYAYQVLRRAQVRDLEILTTVRMPFEASGVLFRVAITNRSAQAQFVKLTIKLRPAIREYRETWHWDPPRPEEKDFADFKASLSGDKVLLVRDARSRSAVAFAFVEQPDDLPAEASAAHWTLNLGPQQTRQIDFVMAAGEDSAEVLERISQWKARFHQVFDAAKDKWEDRFRDAFTPNNRHFSGNLPTLKTSDPQLRRLYYLSILSVLELERTNLHAEYPRVIITAAPRWAPTLTYFWDTSFFPTLYSLLDPVMVKRFLTLFLAADIHSCYAIDMPSLRGVGPWYSFNDYVIFQFVLRYLHVTRDWQFLEEPVAGKKVIDRLEESALYWKRLVSGSSPLASYGTADNLLETVPTYQQRVPALNAANVWMMREVAKLRERTGDAARARDLRQAADQLAKHVLELYVDGKGYWACEFDGGKRVEVRHCIDYFMLISCMAEDLGEQRLREMNDFVGRELWTKDWLYALSPLDGAAKESLRPDHGSTGSFDAWPALTAEAMFLASRKEQHGKAQALQHLQSIDPVTWEGPFGQAHYCADHGRPTRKAVSMDYYESTAGAAFAEIIIRTIFGFSPQDDEGWTWAQPGCPGLSAELLNVRYKGRLLSQKTEA